jgi:hypothetical protein
VDQDRDPLPIIGEVRAERLARGVVEVEGSEVRPFVAPPLVLIMSTSAEKPSTSLSSMNSCRSGVEICPQS